MSLLANHLLLATKILTPAELGRFGGGSSGSTYTMTAHIPVVGSLILCTVGGVQGRAITGITGYGSGWNNLNDGNRTESFAWKFADGTETTSVTVTMNGAQTGVCMIQEFANISGFVERTETLYGPATSAVSSTFTHAASCLAISGVSTNSSDNSWTNFNNGFGNLFTSSYHRTVSKIVYGNGTGNITWSGSNSRSGSVQTLLFKIKTKKQ